MTRDNSYAAVMARKNEIMKSAVGMDYSRFESGSIAFDYEGMLDATGLSLGRVQEIQARFSVGNTPILELHNLTALARKLAPSGKGARIFIKDEACNPSGSFKARRATTSIYTAQQMGYKGAIAATSGNYGAAVASMCAMAGLKCIVIQECFDSRGIGQPEIIEKARKCEALGAEVVQLSVGPELFYVFLRMLEDTGYFNASLYTAYGILGIETLGSEIAQQFRADVGADPTAVICTNAGGGNLTGTARGLKKLGCDARIIGASVNLRGLHMASDKQFNRKSFTTGHTGFGIPFSTWPDRSDVPRSAARPLRYLDEYYTVNQGEVFYITEALTSLEGIERGPAGNIALTAAFALAQTMDREETIVVQETEYTGAGKHLNAQLSFARNNGIDIHFGNPDDEVPGESIILPEHPRMIKAREADLMHMRYSLIRNALATTNGAVTDADIDFLAEETKTDRVFVQAALKKIEQDKTEA